MVRPTSRACSWCRLSRWRLRSPTRTSWPLELWTSTDIVSTPPAPDTGLPTRHILVVPANPRLEGTAFPYFPRGGPLPPQDERSSSSSSGKWGGLEAGTGMLYPAQCIDGRVHAEGGRELRAALDVLIRDRGNGGVVDPGGAVMSTAPGGLHYDGLVHAVGPLGEYPGAGEVLRGCHRSALECVAAAGEDFSGIVVAAVPLIGAGAGGFSSLQAATAALDVAGAYIRSNRESLILRLVANNSEDALTWKMVLIDCGLTGQFCKE